MTLCGVFRVFFPAAESMSVLEDLMVRFAVIAASAFLVASTGAWAGSSGDSGDPGVSAVPTGQSETYDQYAHGNGSLGTLNQSDLDHFLGEGPTDNDLRGSADDEGANMRLNMPDATLPPDNSVTRSGNATVTKQAARFNPADFASLDAIRGAALASMTVETKTGKTVGHVGKVANARGHVQSVTVDLDDGRSVKIGADKLRYNRKDAFLLTNLDAPELEQLAAAGG
jgi:hypothetical protein